jgi:hypothetical protein
MLGLTKEEHKDIAYIIIDDYFLKNYLPSVNENKKWYDNLSNFVLKEWNRVANKDVESKFDEDDEEEINMQAFHILMDRLDIDEDEYEEYEQEIDWGRFEEIIGYYICCL